MQQPTRILLVGLGGYGQSYVNELLDGEAELGAQFVGALCRAYRIEENTSARSLASSATCTSVRRYSSP